MEEILLNYDDVIEAMSITVGSGSLFSNGGQNAKLANFYLVLKDEREEISTVTAERMRRDFEQIKDFKVTIEQLSDGPPTGSPIGVKLLGDDLDMLGVGAVTIAQALETIPGTTNITTSANNNSTEFVLTLDKEKTAALGLNPQVVSQTLRAAVYGTEATAITSISDDIAVVVRLNLTNQPTVDPEYANGATIDTLENIELVTPVARRCSWPH
ncbi:MAG: efflux RND transporter permease subunit [Candidatus Paceibacterota bacterium]